MDSKVMQWIRLLPVLKVFGSATYLLGNIGYVLKTMWASGNNFALAISQDAQRGVNLGILDGCLQDEVDVVIDRITAAKTHACHPLLVPTILCELVTERNIQRIKASEGEMNSIELDTGEHIYEYRVQPDLQSIDSGGSMTARVNGTATTSNFTAANIKSTILAFKAILANLDSPSPSFPRATPHQLQHLKDGRALKECIQHCLGICYNLQLEAEQIQARAKTQISAVRYDGPPSPSPRAYSHVVDIQSYSSERQCPKPASSQRLERSSGGSSTQQLRHENHSSANHPLPPWDLRRCEDSSPPIPSYTN